MTTLESLIASRGLALTRFAYVLCGDAHAAEDLVQSALERTFKRWRDGGFADRPEAYVRQVIAREFVSSRRGRSATEVVVAELPEHAADQSGTHDDRDLLWRQLATLPRTQRAVLVLRYYEDLDDASISRLLGCTRGAVRSASSRGLATLRTSATLVKGMTNE